MGCAGAYRPGPGSVHSNACLAGLTGSPGTAPVRLSLIGAGQWGRVIARSLEEVPHTHLARLATRSAQRPPWLSPDCVMTSDASTAVTADDIDGVIIATPTSLHADLAMLAIRAGKAVLVEKPMTHTAESAQALLDLARSRGGIVRVNHIDLHNPAWKELKERLIDIGPVVGVELAFGGREPARDDVPPRWDWGAHPLALLFDLVGPPTSVRAHHVAVRTTRSGLIERVRIDLGFKGGVAATIATGNAFDIRRRRVAVHGQAASLVYDDNSRTKLTRLVDHVVEPLPISGGMALTCSLEAFVGSIRRGVPDLKDVVLGHSVITTLTAVDECLQ